jgi:hypothetical protein
MVKVNARESRDKSPKPLNQTFSLRIEQYKRTANSPGFVMATDGGLYRIDKFQVRNAKQLDYWA